MKLNPWLVSVCSAGVSSSRRCRLGGPLSKGVASVWACAGAAGQIDASRRRADAQ